MCRVLDTYIDINAPPERVWNVVLDSLRGRSGTRSFRS